MGCWGGGLLFEQKRNPGVVDWIPHLIDEESGIGRQVSVADLNGDQRPDIVVGGMKGAHVLRQPATGWKQPVAQATQPWIAPLKRAQTALSPDQSQVPGAVEAEEIPFVDVSEGKISVQEMTGFASDRWRGGKQVFCSEGKPGSQIKINLKVEKSGRYDLVGSLTPWPPTMR